MPMASKTALDGHQTYTFALCAHKIIETHIETPGNIHGHQGDFLIRANKYFFKSAEEYRQLEQQVMLAFTQRNENAHDQRTEASKRKQESARG